MTSPLGSPTVSSPTAASGVTEEYVVPVADRVITRPRPGRWVTYAVVALVVAMLVYSVLTNDNWHWDVVRAHLLDSAVLKGLAVTVVLTVAAMILGLVLGSVVAALRLSESRILSAIAGWYIWFFRGVPVIVQVIFFVYLGQLYPYLGLGVPFGGPKLAFYNTNDLIAPIVGCIIGLCLNESAYQAEIIRGAVASVPKGQREAAAALGMTPWQVRRRVIAPQILPVAVPPFFNDVISMTKTTAVVILASVTDLFSAVSQIGARTFQQVPLLLVATFWYLVLTAVITLLQIGLERILTRHNRPS
ncbi:amino acid ABC transporter permease [Nocardioides sp. DS6]|uniref:Amino acid ABC transporter permease n=1 Tax=Nocardioides eburneus TaxID=3231482 RepID=A0ABV3T3F1_9ACTN